MGDVDQPGTLPRVRLGESRAETQNDPLPESPALASSGYDLFVMAATTVEDNLAPPTPLAAADYPRVRENGIFSHERQRACTGTGRALKQWWEGPHPVPRHPLRPAGKRSNHRGRAHARNRRKLNRTLNATHRRLKKKKLALSHHSLCGVFHAVAQRLVAFQGEGRVLETPGLRAPPLRHVDHTGLGVGSAELGSPGAIRLDDAIRRALLTGRMQTTHSSPPDGAVAARHPSSRSSPAFQRGPSNPTRAKACALLLCASLSPPPLRLSPLRPLWVVCVQK